MSTILDTKPATQNHDQTNWLIHARTRKQQQLDLIPPEWTILVPKGILNVTQVPYECGVLDELELTITDTVDVAVILEKLRDRIWSSVQVTKAFYKRAIIAHQTTNCLTEIFIERALARAAEMDKYLKDNGKLMGPLHGLPVSLKDQFTMKGLETINGYVANIGDFATEDAVLVDILYQLGAVPFVRTNLPQTLMWGETCNNVFGRTLNPHNLNLTSGGSSGGEGALIAMHGSPLGIGTDIGGSLRIPASMCGIYALRPSYCRLPFHGIRNTLDGQESIMCVIGPMANSLSGLKMFTKAVIDTRPWLRDPLCIRKVWDEDAYQLVDHGGRGGRKCFAMLYDNGLVKPHPPVFRAMETTKKALEAAGHQVIEWQNHKHEEIFINVVTKLYFSDGGEEFRRECERSGEPRIMTMDPTLYSAENYNAETNKGKPIFDPLSVYELWQVHKQKRELRKEYLDLWQSTISRTNTGRPVDAVISPAAPFASAPHGKNTFTFYTSLWNCLDYVTGALPVTVVDLELDEPSPPHTFYNANDEAIYNSYDPEIYKYAPVGLQVTGRTLEEEGVLAMMEEIDEALKKYKMDSSS